MGASLALAGMTACRWPEEEILPFADRPLGTTPGDLRYYATSMETAGGALGLLVVSSDGRPIKIEGNPAHPASRGATSAIAQAAVLELYDPDRSRSATRRAGAERVDASWSEFVEFAIAHAAGWRENGGARLRVLTEACSSPTRRAMRMQFLHAFPAAKWYEFEPVSRDNEREGIRMAYGRTAKSDDPFGPGRTRLQQMAE